MQLSFAPDPAIPNSDEAAAAAAAAAVASGKAEVLPRAWTERVFGSEQQTTYYHQLERFATDLSVLEGRSDER
jgi:hypothetical protein